MSNLYKKFKTNSKLEIEGIIAEYADGTDAPASFKLARAGGGNVNFAKAMERAGRPYRRAILSGNLDAKVAEKMYREVFAETVILGWSNVEGADGPIAFSKDNAVKLLEDLPDLYADLREQANDASLFREEVLEAALGNSGQSLSTASSKDQ